MENTGFKVYIEKRTQDYGKLYIEALERGYGDTLGNALRRLLLSSIKGAAVTAVRIDGILHEFSTIKGVREDVIEILMNLKHIPIKAKQKTAAKKGKDSESASFKIITLDSEELPKDFFTRKENPGVITAKDMPWDSDFEFCGNGVLCTLEPDAKLLMEIYVEQGVGYLSAERERPSQPALPIDALLTDAIFSPVKRVNYEIEPARVGQSIDFERLVLEVWTNGAISPEEAVTEAARIAQSYFGQIAENVASLPLEPMIPEPTPEPLAPETPEPPKPKFDPPIHELELSIRSENCLMRGGIQTVGDLLSRSRDDLLKIRNLGKISLTEIEERLKTLGYELSKVSMTPAEEPEDIKVKPIVVDEVEKPETKSEVVEAPIEIPEEPETDVKPEPAPTPKPPKTPRNSRGSKKDDKKEKDEKNEKGTGTGTKTTRKKSNTEAKPEPVVEAETKTEAKPKAKPKAKSKTTTTRTKAKTKTKNAEKLVDDFSSKKAPKELLADIVREADEAEFPDDNDEQE